MTHEGGHVIVQPPNPQVAADGETASRARRERGVALCARGAHDTLARGR